ncbi:MAG: trigger factor [Ilumatobacteraceae bacterium]
MRSTITPTDDPQVGVSTDDTASTDPPAARRLVTLSVEIDEDEFDRDIDRAFRTIAAQVRMPGFRQGKAPRKVLEARIGIEAAREQALRDAVPGYLARAVREHDVDLIATPEISITGGADAGPVSFDAVCEIRPEVIVPGYAGLRVELPSPTATDAEVDEAVEAERRRQGSLVAADRPARHGDHVTLDLSAVRDGEPVPGLSTEDWLYEIGKGWVAEGFDDQLAGTAAGTTLEFSATPSGTDTAAEFTVKVTAVQEMVLPEIDDAWVAENIGGHDTVESWRASIAERIGTGKLNQARNVFIDRVMNALAELVDAPIPASMVNGDLQGRVQNTVQQFRAQGIPIEQFLQITGQTADQFIDQLREQSVRAVKVDLALRAVAVAEAIEVGDDDLDAEFGRMAIRMGQKAATLRRRYDENDAIPELVAQIRKNKALDWLVEHVELVDEAGAPIERGLILGADHDHDHDHDHEH